VISHTETRSILKNILTGGLHHKKHLTTEFLELLRKTGRRKGFPAAFKSVMRNWKSWIEAKIFYRHIKVPVALIYGNEDWSLAEERMVTRDLIPGCRYQLLPNVGHFISLEDPAEMVKIILRGP